MEWTPRVYTKVKNKGGEVGGLGELGKGLSTNTRPTRLCSETVNIRRTTGVG